MEMVVTLVAADGHTGIVIVTSALFPLCFPLASVTAVWYQDAVAADGHTVIALSAKRGDGVGGWAAGVDAGAHWYQDAVAVDGHTVIALSAKRGDGRGGWAAVLAHGDHHLKCPTPLTPRVLPPSHGVAADGHSVIALSAKRGDGVDGLLAWMLDNIPQGPAYYPKPSRRTRQRDIRDMVDDSARARLDYLWAAAVADNDWAFHTSKSPAVQNFVDAAVAFGKQYTLPSPFRVSGVLLQKLVADTEDLVRPLKESWNTSGCTISVDGGTCMKSRGLVCVIAHNDTAPVIVKTMDSKTAKKTGEYLAGLIRTSIAEVGDKKVVQVVMDNASNNRRAADILRDGFPAVFFNNCAAHVLDLMLHDIGKVRAVRRVLNQVHRVVMIVKGSASAVTLFHELFSTLSLVRPGATRFGTQVIMLTRFLEVKKALKEMIISEEWESVAVARSEEGRAVRQLLLDEVFWECATAVLRLMTPVYEVLRVVDTRALVMGQIYGLMLDATVKTNNAAEAAGKL
ncbi:unnamed protein product [Closterium sp. NIES-64]|nr:unnamed protein product [Closterium sp. NIES-64]